MLSKFIYNLNIEKHDDLSIIKFKDSRYNPEDVLKVMIDAFNIKDASKLNLNQFKKNLMDFKFPYLLLNKGKLEGYMLANIYPKTYHKDFLKCKTDHVIWLTEIASRVNGGGTMLMSVLNNYKLDQTTYAEKQSVNFYIKKGYKKIKYIKESGYTMMIKYV